MASACGYDTIPTDDTVAANDRVVGYKNGYVASDGGNLTYGYARVGTKWDSVNIKVLVCDMAGNIIASAAAAWVAGTWVQVTFGAGAIVKDTTYFLGLISDGNGDLPADSSAGWDLTADNSGSYDAPPDPVDIAGDISGIAHVGVYVEVEAAGAVVPTGGLYGSLVGPFGGPMGPMGGRL